MTTALVIGAGPAGLMAADVLATAGHTVTVAEQMPSVGRKFLMAGKSGLNLTKDEPQDSFRGSFGDAPDAFLQAIDAFGPDAVQKWARDLGEEVFTGTTGRVFPKVMKASPLLRAWLRRLQAAGVTILTRYRWTGWRDGTAQFATPSGPSAIPAAVTVLALGGASWSRLGADGTWANHLSGVAPFRPANCGFTVNWSSHMAPYFGQPVKATALKAGAILSRGEWVITRDGVEGGGIYEVSSAVRDGAPLEIDLMPDTDLAATEARLKKRSRKASRAQLLKSALRLSPIKAALINEFARSVSPDQIATNVKRLRLPPLTPFPMDDAISTAGGVRFDRLSADFMLLDRPGVFVAGEMMDWEAPTGGYLLTGCLASGRIAGLGAVGWLTARFPG